MPQTTLKRYLALLETAFLLVAVPAWFRNVGKRLAKSPKLLLSDPGLLAHAVIEARGGGVCGVEVKAAATLTSRDSRGLRGLADSLGDDFIAGVILHGGSESAPLAERIWALPVSALWAPASGAGK